MLKPGDDLFLLSGGRELYEGYTVAGIDCTPGYEHIEFGNTREVVLGKAIGDVDENVVKRAQIRRTVEAFLEKAVEIIRDNRHALAIDGISYIKLDGEEYYAQEIFDSAELLANLDRNAVKVEHSVHDYIVYDSGSVEKPFALALDRDPDVKMFFKIPSRFKIETPIGTYNPDWAVYLTRNGEEKLYFILETKGSTSLMELRTREQLKIHCGKKHFEALENGVEMQTASSWGEFKRIL